MNLRRPLRIGSTAEALKMVPDGAVVEDNNCRRKREREMGYKQVLVCWPRIHKCIMGWY